MLIKYNLSIALQIKKIIFNSMIKMMMNNQSLKTMTMKAMINQKKLQKAFNKIKQVIRHQFQKASWSHNNHQQSLIKYKKLTVVLNIKTKTKKWKILKIKMKIKGKAKRRRKKLQDSQKSSHIFKLLITKDT